MKIVLGVTGSVAAKLTAKMVKALLSAGHEVKVVATSPGLYFFDSDDVRQLGVEVMSDKVEWPEGGYIKSSPVPHIDLGDWAELLLIAPATYNTIGKLAAGLADNFLCCIAAAWPKDSKPMLLAPAMNTRMWADPVVADNLAKIGQRFAHLDVILPVEGQLACGVTGVGAMARVETIVDRANGLQETAT